MSKDITPQGEITQLLITMTSVGKLLSESRDLTDREIDVISGAVSLLETFINVWKVRLESDRWLRKNEPSWWRNVAAQGAARDGQAPVKRNLAAVVLGRMGASKGGKALALTLSPKRRAAIAKAAAAARWSKVVGK